MKYSRIQLESNFLFKIKKGGAYNVQNRQINRCRDTRHFVRLISRRAGHASLSTTLNIYGHLIQDGDQAASNSIRNMLLKDKTQF
jgi:integrase